MPLELLKPFETFFHANLPPGPIRQMMFEFFRVMHLYLYEYPDYLLFGIFCIPPFFLVPRRWRVAYLLAVSVGFIAILYGPIFSLCLAGFPLAMHFVVRRIQPQAIADRTFRRRSITILVLLTLGVYGALLARETWEWTPMIPLVGKTFWLPLLHWCGIAFMLPKLIHYIVDSLQGKIEDAPASHTVLFLIFFPTLRLGPIERYQNFARDIAHGREHDVNLFDIGFGLYRIALGAAKVALYAAVLWPMREQAQTHIGEQSWIWLLWIMYAGIIEVYCHFGGYTDIAIGFSRLLGFRMMENFYLPVLAENIGEWWRRWHISLSFWLRDYVYRPLGGSRKRAFLNAIITFFICGAWHYLAWHYIIWGIAQGIGLSILFVWKRFWRRVYSEADYYPSLKPLVGFMVVHPVFSYWVGVVTTIHYFCITGVYFILEHNDATYYLLRFFTFGYYV